MQLMVDWITENTHPLSIMADSGLEHLLAFLEPSFTIPSRTHLASIIKQRYEQGKKELVKVLRQQASAIVITTNLWTSKATKSFAT